MKPSKPLLNERMKMLRMKADRARQEADANRPKRPPNMRVTDGHSSCSQCQHFDPKGQCTLHNYPVKPFHLSDSFAQKGGQTVTIQIQGAPQEAPPNPPGA